MVERPQAKGALAAAQVRPMLAGLLYLGTFDLACVTSPLLWGRS